MGLNYQIQDGNRLLIESEKMKGEAFAKGLSQLGTSMAINDASKKVQGLQEQQLDEKQRLMATQQIGQELALKMAQFNSDPQQIQAATQGLVPSASQQSQMIGQQEMQESSQGHDLKKQGIDHKHAMDLQREKNKMFDVKNDRKFGSFITGYQNKFNSETKDLNKQFQSMQMAEQVLKSGNPIGDQSVGVMFARASGDVGAVSDYAEQKFKGTKQLTERINQAKSEWESGKLSPQNRQFMIELSQQFQQAKHKNIKEVAKKYSMQAAGAAAKGGHDTTEEEMEKLINPFQPEASKHPKQAEIDAGNALLQSMKATDPRRARVEEKLKKLQGPQ